MFHCVGARRSGDVLDSGSHTLFLQSVRLDRAEAFQERVLTNVLHLLFFTGEEFRIPLGLRTYDPCCANQDGAFCCVLSF